MTNLTIPVASATQGVLNNMPDVIDSLKRLERIGSEQSKTVQKILEAAGDLEKTIVEQYGRAALPCFIDGSSILAAIKAAGHFERTEDVANELGIDRVRASQMRYELDWEAGFGGLIRARHSHLRISEDRETALKFSRDIADGLLLLIEQDLNLRQSENVDALALLGTAKEALDAKKKAEQELMKSQW